MLMKPGQRGFPPANRNAPDRKMPVAMRRKHSVLPTFGFMAGSRQDFDFAIIFTARATSLDADQSLTSAGKSPLARALLRSGRNGPAELPRQGLPGSAPHLETHAVDLRIDAIDETQFVVAGLRNPEHGCPGPANILAVQAPAMAWRRSGSQEAHSLHAIRMSGSSAMMLPLPG